VGEAQAGGLALQSLFCCQSAPLSGAAKLAIGLSVPTVLVRCRACSAVVCIDVGVGVMHLCWDRHFVLSGRLISGSV
jgi:hypothetical protein